MVMKPTIRTLIAAIGLLVVLSGIATAAPVTQSITYQGKLTNAAGTPLTGTYTVIFKLYDASTGGTTLSTDTHSVTATTGLFTTSIAVTDPKLVDGRALWLGIKVGSDPEMAPRQEIRPVPYALSLRPGAVVQDASFTSSTAGTSWSTIKPGINVSTQYNYNPAISFNTSGSLSYGIFGNTRGPNSYGAALSTEGLNSHGLVTNTKGSGSPGVYASTTGSSSPAIWGESAQDIGVKGIGKTGGYFSTNSGGSSWLAQQPGVNISTTFDNNPGIMLTTSGLYSEGILLTTGGQYSSGISVWTRGESSEAVEAETNGPNSTGVDVNTGGLNSMGIRSITYGNKSYGVYIVTHGDKSPAVRALTSGPDSFGVDVSTGGQDSRGISSLTSGNNSPGVYSRTSGDSAYAVVALTSGNNSPGVYSWTSGSDSEGLWSRTQGPNSVGLWSNTQGPNSRGLYVLTENTTSPGVVAHTYKDYSEGVYSVTDGVYSHGVYVKALGSSSQGVNASSAQATAVWADTGRADHMYGVQTPDYMRAARYDTGSSDVAEYWPVTGDVTPGTVLILGVGGILHESTQAYDTRVAGIVSTEPGISLGTRDGGNPGEQLIALAGRVPCRVDASSAPIQSGDLLTTSDTPGHAMKAEPTLINGRGFYPDGTILGKAAGSLESGTGTIEVLVTLQ